MTNKSLKFSILSAIALLFLVGFVSAVTITSISPSTLLTSVGTHDFTVNFTGTQDESVSFGVSGTKDLNGNNVSFTGLTNLVLTGVTTGSRVISYTIPTEFDSFKYAPILTLTGNVSSADTETLSFDKTNFCYFDDNTFNSSYLNSNDGLNVEIDDITVINGFGDDEDWVSFDEVEIEVIVSNENSNDDINNIVLEWGLFDKDNGKWAIELTDENDFDLRDGDEETKIISFKLNNKLDLDLDELGDNLVFYARATGDLDLDDEQTVCGDDSEVATIAIEKDFVLTENVKMLETISCGSEMQITGEVWNIGTKDQDDVSINVYNKELGIDETLTMGDIDSFDGESFAVTVSIPKDATEKAYKILFSTYDEDNDIYQTSDDIDSEKVYVLTVSGACSNLPLATVSAELTSESQAGDELVIKATVVNTDSKKNAFTFSLDGYSDWASLVNIDKTAFELAAGASQEVLITLNTNENVTGQKTFNLIVKQGTKTLSQPVSVSFEEEKSANVFSNIKDFLASKIGSNWYLWLIGALNVILVVVIIVVATKIFKKK